LARGFAASCRGLAAIPGRASAAGVGLRDAARSGDGPPRSPGARLRVRELPLAANGEYEIILDSGAKVRMSRSYREQLQGRLGVGA
jgi:hypothetical protein